MKKEDLVVTLIAEDFKDVDYSDNNDCALARAVRRLTGVEKNSVGVDCMFVYIHTDAGTDEYKNGVFDAVIFTKVNMEMKTNPAHTHTLTLKYLEPVAD